MQLLHNRILAAIIEDEPTESGIIISTDYRTKKYKARVLSVGPKVKHLKIGDAIQYDHNECQPYEIDGQKCIFIRENLGFISRL